MTQFAKMMVPVDFSDYSTAAQETAAETAKTFSAKIKLESSAGTGHFYTTVKNKTNTPGKVELNKYDPVVRKHVVYKETKLK